MAETDAEGSRQRIKELEAELESCKRRIAHLEAERAGETAGIVKARRTKLLGLSGERCDFVEALPSRITVRELRAKIAASKGIKTQRVKILAQCQEGAEAPILGDDEEICHEVVAQPKAADAEGPQTFDFYSVGEPYHIVLESPTRIVYTGRAKCKLSHNDEYNAYQNESWAGEWVDISVEEKELGRLRHDQLRVFVGNVDLVCYGSLQNPWVRQFETWGNKCAGELRLKVCEERSAPRSKDRPGPYEVAKIAPPGQQWLPVTDEPHALNMERLGDLWPGTMVKVLEVATPEPRNPYERAYRAYVYGRIDFNGRSGWIPLTDTKSGTDFATRCDEERLHKVEIERLYSVERGDGKCHSHDLSEIWFAEEAERGAFVAAYRSWERNNPMPGTTD